MKIPFGKLGLAGAVALAAVSPAAASPGNGNAGGHGQAGQHVPAQHPHAGKGHGQGKTKVHKVTYVFKGTWNSAAGTVTVKSGNAHVRKAGFVGQDVQFDLTGAKLVVADTDGSGTITAADLKDGDQVLVQARLPRKDPGTQPFAARKVVDQTNAPAPDSGESAD